MRIILTPETAHFIEARSFDLCNTEDHLEAERIATFIINHLNEEFGEIKLKIIITALNMIRIPMIREVLKDSVN